MAGAGPAKLLTVTERFNDYAYEVGERLTEAGLRVEVDDRNEDRLQDQRSEDQRDAYMLIIGEREQEAGTVSVRSIKEGELGEMSVEDLIAKLRKEIDTKAY